MDGELTELAIELTLLPGVGTLTQNRVRLRLRDLRALRTLFAMNDGDLAAIGVPKEAHAAIRRRTCRARAGEIRAWAAREDVHLLIAGAPGYPELLEEIHDPPTVLYARGNPEAIRMPAPPCIAIVGTRRPTLYGQRMAEELGAALGERGVTVVSGLARGIDSAAHRGCVDADGVTVAVLGSGVDVIYPRENQRLAVRIMQKGLILSEFPPGTAPAPHNFPIRNRIVSGLSLGALVVEAGERSGSLITARLAMEQNREVFALPGNVTTPQSLGPNYLIKQGAKLVQGWRDIVEELPEEVRRNILLMEDARAHDVPESGAVPEGAAEVLALLHEDEAVHFEQLLAHSGGDISRLSGMLLELETSGHVRQLPGNLYVKLRK
jgi:DNA processing protein